MKSKKKSVKLPSNIVGRWVIVRWDDIGHRDCVVVDNMTDGRLTKRSSLRIYEPYDSGIRTIEASQIVAIGEYLNASPLNHE